MHTIKTVTIFLISVDCELESTAAETLDCVQRWAEDDQLRLAPQISTLKANVQACYSVMEQSAYNSDVFGEPELESEVNNSVMAASVPINSAPDVSTGTCNP